MSETVYVEDNFDMFVSYSLNTFTIWKSHHKSPTSLWHDGTRQANQGYVCESLLGSWSESTI